MGNTVHISTRKGRTGPAIWFALAIALGLHGIFLLLPLTGQIPESSPLSAQIELKLTLPEPLQAAAENLIPEQPPARQAAVQPAPGDTEPAPVPSVNTPFPMPLQNSRVTTLTPIERDLERMTTENKRRLTSAILSSQFITGKSAADQLFGKPMERSGTTVQTEFHYPERPSLVTMLNQPMQELPFEYTPGLIQFAYAPGLKGKLQRFGDRITPEFGWITKYGTEVKCIWVLVIAACGWK